MYVQLCHGDAYYCVDLCCQFDPRWLDLISSITFSQLIRNLFHCVFRYINPKLNPLRTRTTTSKHGQQTESCCDHGNDLSHNTHHCGSSQSTIVSGMWLGDVAHNASCITIIANSRECPTLVSNESLTTVYF